VQGVSLLITTLEKLSLRSLAAFLSNCAKSDSLSELVMETAEFVWSALYPKKGMASGVP